MCSLLSFFVRILQLDRGAPEKLVSVSLVDWRAGCDQRMLPSEIVLCSGLSINLVQSRSFGTATRPLLYTLFSLDSLLTFVVNLLTGRHSRH
jgi:hypothetical protein